MPTLLFGLLALVLGLWALNVISKVDPKVAARVTKAGGGLLAIGFAAFLGLRGEIGIAIPLGIFGLGLLGWMPFGRQSAGRAQASAAARPRRCARPIWKWSSTTTAAACAAGCWRGATRAPPSSSSTSRASSACSPRSTTKAARY